MAINTIATLVLSFVIAVILNQKFKGRILCRIIFFLPVILSSGVLPGIESSNEFFNMMTDIGKSAEESSGVNVSLALQELLQVSGVAGDIFDGFPDDRRDLRHCHVQRHPDHRVPVRTAGYFPVAL